MDETVLATCVIWCLTDVFTYRQGESSWRIHLQGIKAILDSNQAHRHFISGTGSTQVAMRHLYQLYISLQTLPYIPSLPDPETPVYKGLSDPSKMDVLSLSPSDTKIDGFLGYSEELLHILQRIDHLSSLDDQDSSAVNCEADILLGKVKGMIQRDSEISPTVSICASLSPEDTHEFTLCHRTFQQATLIHLYRRLYHLPSRAKPLQTAIESIKEMMNFMVQGQPCHTWVAMAMPLFTIGCEAFTDDQEEFVMDKVNKLEECIGSLHVKIIRQALEDIWEVRKRMGDLEGNICASQLLAELRYNIILF
ncbi:Fungal Zn(2)-Cys(6) binuclear cluster domain [Geosmithia morbida]|uniref:Fungal Zn(2)-Cys(6) binuclear cluster domain n=1 Tax=Geosmithia morbida TaxID=1094350 RepID=A0A9P4Z044_9HYPO|nr:Fungal Zn(2)-Cys(6) binuclear cluster domain [Geosmithia morbida]KAF4126248.1 Fungal Zn(2)-Cys(6) binuclear cluster domain [Geosmithia morbida]